MLCAPSVERRPLHWPLPAETWDPLWSLRVTQPARLRNKPPTLSTTCAPSPEERPVPAARPSSPADGYICSREEGVLQGSCLGPFHFVHSLRDNILLMLLISYFCLTSRITYPMWTNIYVRYLHTSRLLWGS